MPRYKYIVKDQPFHSRSRSCIVKGLSVNDLFQAFSYSSISLWAVARSGLQLHTTSYSPTIYKLRFDSMEHGDVFVKGNLFSKKFNRNVPIILSGHVEDYLKGSDN